MARRKKEAMERVLDEKGGASPTDTVSNMRHASRKVMKTAKPALVMRIINPVRIRVYDRRAEAKKLKVAERNKKEKKAKNEVKNVILVSGIKKTCKNVKVVGIVSKPRRVAPGLEL